MHHRQVISLAFIDLDRAVMANEGGVGSVLKRMKAWGKIKRQSIALPFSPNLTMNLTYLCYGPPKVK
jgi:hypothetical protein